MVLITNRFWEQDLWNLRREAEYRARTISYPLGKSARDTLKEWHEKGFRDNIEDEFGGIISEEKQVKLAKLTSKELLNQFFFEDRRFCSWKIFPENRTEAMTDLERVVIVALETHHSRNGTTQEPTRLSQVHYEDQRMYRRSSHTFQKYGKKHSVDLEVDLNGTEIASLFFVTDHPGSGSPVVYFDRRIIYNNAPEDANVYIIGGIKRICTGKELKPFPEYDGEVRSFIWSPIIADTRIAPINFPKQTRGYEGYCLVPIKYFAVDEKMFLD